MQKPTAAVKNKLERHVIAVSLKLCWGALRTDLHRRTCPAPTSPRSPASRRWRWWAARSPRRTRAAGCAARRTPGCWPSPPSARRSARTPPAGSAAWAGDRGYTRPRAPARTRRENAPRPCLRPARSGPAPWRWLRYLPAPGPPLRSCCSSLDTRAPSEFVLPRVRLINSHQLWLSRTSTPACADQISPACAQSKSETGLSNGRLTGPGHGGHVSRWSKNKTPLCRSRAARALKSE